MFVLQLRFYVSDVMTDLLHDDLTRYDITFCFSVTLWIHLNNGDSGLEQFLSSISSSTTYLLLETQPWKCYRTAARRAKRAGQPPYPLYDSLKIRGNVTEYIDRFITDKCGMRKVKELGITDWGRKIVLYCENKI